MKKLFTSLLMLMALLCSTTAFAADYNITIGGTKVTDANKADIKPAGLTKGKIEFNSSSNQLTFTDVTLNSGDKMNIDVGTGFSRLTVRFYGTNNFTSDDHNFRFDSTVTLDGGMNKDATVNITNTVSGRCGIIFANFDDFNAIYNMYLNVKTVATAIAADWANEGKVDLWLSCMHMNVESSSSSAFNYFKSIHFDNGDAYPTEGHFDASKQTVVDDSGNPLSTVKVRAGLYVNNCIPRLGSGEAVYTLNPEGLTSGTITYQASTKTLTFDNAQMELGSAYFLTNNKVDDLKVIVKGTNSLKNKVAGITLFANTTFEGADASNYASNVMLMTSSGKSYPGIVCHGCDLTMKNINLWVTAQRALEGENGHTITLDHAGGILGAPEGADNPKAINGFSNCVLANQTDFSSAYYSTTKRVLIDNEGNEAKAVLFAAYTNEYPIWILGHQLNDVNSPLGFACEGAKGKIVYSNSDKKLTLEDVTLAAPSGADAYGIRSQVDGLTIQLDGSANSVTSDRSAFYLENNADITGTAKLTAESTNNGSGISIYGNHKVTINVNNEVYFTGTDYGYWGHHEDSNPDCDLILTKAGDESDYYFKGKLGSIFQLSHLICNDMDFYYSSNYGTPGCYFDETDHCVKQNGGTLVKGSDVNFYNIKDTYLISVCGISLNNCNSRAVGSPYIKSGPLSVCYDSDEKALTLDNAEIVNNDPESSSHAITIQPGFDGKIILVGDNSIIDPHYSAVVNDGDAKTVFSGDGSLYVQGDQYGLLPWKGTMIIADNVTIEAKGNTHGIGANNDGTAGETLIIRDNAVVKASSIGGLNTITIEGEQSILEPAGAKIMKLAEGWAVCVDGVVAKNVVIMKVVDYGFYFARAELPSIYVTNANAADIFGDGKVSYDPDTKTLTLDNANYFGALNNMKVDGLKINIVGTCNTLYDDNSNLLYLNAPTTITGTGTWNLKLTDPNPTCFYIVTPDAGTTKAELTFDGPTVNVTAGNNRCFAGYNADTKLSFISGTFSYQGTGRPIQNVQTVVLGEGMYITEPAGATLNESNTVIVDGSAYTGNFLVSNTDAIQGIDEDKASVTDVYDMAGRKLDQTRRGINIVRTNDGKTHKVVKK